MVLTFISIQLTFFFSFSNVFYTLILRCWENREKPPCKNRCNHMCELINSSFFSRAAKTSKVKWSGSWKYCKNKLNSNTYANDLLFGIRLSFDCNASEWENALCFLPEVHIGISWWIANETGFIRIVFVICRNSLFGIARASCILLWTSFDAIVPFALHTIFAVV